MTELIGAALCKLLIDSSDGALLLCGRDGFRGRPQGGHGWKGNTVTGAMPGNRGCPRNCKRRACFTNATAPPTAKGNRGKAEAGARAASQETCRHKSSNRHAGRVMVRSIRSGDW